MRDLKFRWWVNNKMNYFSLGETNRYPSNIMDFPIMQFTGLTDKHGKEIWEGDILEMDGGGTEKVIFNVDFEDGCFVARVPWKKESSPELKYYTLFAHLEDDKVFKDAVLVKVIGNIYENSELLNQKQSL